jgi:hypothetical protein
VTEILLFDIDEPGLNTLGSRRSGFGPAPAMRRPRGADPS